MRVRQEKDSNAMGFAMNVYSETIQAHRFFRATLRLRGHGGKKEKVQLILDHGPLFKLISCL